MFKRALEGRESLEERRSSFRRNEWIYVSCEWSVFTWGTLVKIEHYRGRLTGGELERLRAVLISEVDREWLRMGRGDWARGAKGQNPPVVMSGGGSCPEDVSNCSLG